MILRVTGNTKFDMAMTKRLRNFLTTPVGRSLKDKIKKLKIFHLRCSIAPSDGLTCVRRRRRNIIDTNLEHDKRASPPRDICRLAANSPVVDTLPDAVELITP